MVSKGKISAISKDGNYAAVTRFTGEIVTAEMVVPRFLAGHLSAGDTVIYSMFEDNTGIILHKGDGSGGGASGNISAKIEDNILKVFALEPETDDDNESGSGSGSGTGTNFKIDETLSLSDDGVLSVNTADVVEQDNTLPVTSAAVHTAVGNIEALLKLI